MRLENGLVKDFTMNKACAAGTGSFLEEQAEKLGISIKRDFARLALAAEHPVDCGEQCTVFIDSEVCATSSGARRSATSPGASAYSIATNYLHRVVEKRPVGDHILFQGGVAFNMAVLAAFERLTGKAITVPPHNEVMGAIGCCLIARRKMLETPGVRHRVHRVWGARKRVPAGILPVQFVREPVRYQQDIGRRASAPVLRRALRTLRGAALFGGRGAAGSVRGARTPAHVRLSAEGQGGLEGRHRLSPYADLS